MPKKEKKIPNGVEIIFSYRSRRRHIKTKKNKLHVANQSQMTFKKL